jgi:hypothetical protein
MSEEKSEQDLINIIPLDNYTRDIAEQIVKEEDFNKVKDLTALFNLNQSKRNVIRVMKLNSLLDKVSDSMIERFKNRPGEFSNKDLLDYMTTVQNAIDRANKSLDLTETPPTISLNQQNNVNINVSAADNLDRDSKERITAAIKAILAKAKEEDIIYVDKEEN